MRFFYGFAVFYYYLLAANLFHRSLYYKSPIRQFKFIVLPKFENFIISLAKTRDKRLKIIIYIKIIILYIIDFREAIFNLIH